MPTSNKFLFYKKMRKKGYNRCMRDNSIRKCCGYYCPFYKWKLRYRLKEWLSDKLCDFTYKLEGFINGRR